MIIDNTLIGLSGNDTLTGKDGDDVLTGNDGNDTLRGDSGNDILNGNGDADVLFGGEGDDILTGGGGDDALVGGAGSDEFVLFEGEGNDQIKDFQDGVDFLSLVGGLTFGALTISQNGGDTLIQVTATSQTIATLQDIDATLISGADFI